MSRAFEGVQALDGVTLDVNRHEVVGLIGPNGAGKTTLVNLLTGFDRPTEGSIELGERDITRWAPHRRGRAGVARTFQHSRSFRSLSVRENVELAALGVGAGPRVARRRADELLDLLGLKNRAATAASTLAHGDERRLGVARALATEPRFVLLDEPAAGLPEAEVPEFASVVRAVRDDHEAGVLLIDHNMALIMDVCDRIHVLDQGRTLAAGHTGRDPRQPRRRRRLPRRERRPRGRGMTALLELRGLDVRYGSVAAVRALDLTVGEGEIVGLIGPNGAGKSTTLHAIMGLVPPSGGDVVFAGTSIRGRRPENVARSGIALVPEGRRIYPQLTVEENLRLGLAGRRDRNGSDAAIARVHELFPVVADFAGRRAGTLSGGQQQQLAIGRALVADPRLLLLDEPSLGLAPRIVDVVFETLAEVRAQGITVLLVEQRAQRTVAFADRTYLVANGELRLTLEPGDADDTERMVAAYLS